MNTVTPYYFTLQEVDLLVEATEVVSRYGVSDSAFTDQDFADMSKRLDTGNDLARGSITEDDAALLIQRLAAALANDPKRIRISIDNNFRIEINDLGAATVRDLHRGR